MCIDCDFLDFSSLYKLTSLFKYGMPTYYIALHDEQPKMLDQNVFLVYEYYSLITMRTKLILKWP